MREKLTKRKKKKTVSSLVIAWIYILLFVSVLVMFGFSLVGLESVEEILAVQEYYLCVGVMYGIILIAFLLMYRVDAQNVAMNENDLEDTSWLSIKKLKKLKEFSVNKYSDVKHLSDGIVIGAEKKAGNVEIVSTSNLHALIVGTTGSGKTTGFVDQNIAVLSKTKTKPCLVITDPKKELYEKHANGLAEQGYKISTLDLREPYSSKRWNPMNVLIRRIHMVKDLENNLKSINGKYYGAGEEFLSYSDARTRKQELLDEIYENAQDLVYTICPVNNKDQPTWEEGARNLIFGLVLAFCEDCIKGTLEEKQLLLFNIYHNITKYCSEDTTALKEYLLNGRDEFSKVKGLVNTVLITSDKTLTSYLAEVNSYMFQLADDGILSLTSENEIDISSLDDEPNAVFVIVPDERVTRHRFVTLFITQMYKEMVDKANLNLRRGDTDTAILKRNAYFVMDEYGNLPRFENMEGMVTVARSRGIRFLFVLQSFSQLTAKYGREIGDIIKSNCNVKIFIGSDDSETRKEFSELCGQKKIKSFSVNTNADNPASANTGASNTPLITVGMLERLNGNEKGDAIVSVRGYEPIWTKFTPSFKLKNVYFPQGFADISKREAVMFNKANYLFDIVSRDKKLEDILLDRLDEAEKSIEILPKQSIESLDKEWDSVRASIDDKFSKIENYLDKSDIIAYRQAKLENKITLLYNIAGKHKEVTKEKIISFIYFSEDMLKRLKTIQEKVR